MQIGCYQNKVNWYRMNRTESISIMNYGQIRQACQVSLSLSRKVNGQNKCTFSWYNFDALVINGK